MSACIERVKKALEELGVHDVLHFELNKLVVQSPPSSNEKYQVSIELRAPEYAACQVHLMSHSEGTSEGVSKVFKLINELNQDTTAKFYTDTQGVGDNEVGSLMMEINFFCLLDVSSLKIQLDYCFTHLADIFNKKQEHIIKGYQQAGMIAC